MELSRSIYTVLLLAMPLPFVTAAPVADPQRQDGAVTAAALPPAPAPSTFATARFPQATPATLDQLRGGSEAVASSVNNNVASDTQLRGATDHNSATDIVTGNNMIQSSFAGAAGIPVVIQNSGANVLIQNATVVNLQFK